MHKLKEQKIKEFINDFNGNYMYIKNLDFLGKKRGRHTNRLYNNEERKLFFLHLIL